MNIIAYLQHTMHWDTVMKKTDTLLVIKAEHRNNAEKEIALGMNATKKKTELKQQNPPQGNCFKFFSQNLRE